MSDISIRIDTGEPTGGEVLDRIRAELRRELARAIKRLGRDGLKRWRSRTPRITGVLRASETARVRIDHGRGFYGAEFRVGYPGSIYYRTVAGRPQHKHLRNLASVRKWARRHAGSYVDAATAAAGFSH